MGAVATPSISDDSNLRNVEVQPIPPGGHRLDYRRALALLVADLLQCVPEIADGIGARGSTNVGGPQMGLDPSVAYHRPACGQLLGKKQHQLEGLRRQSEAPAIEHDLRLASQNSKPCRDWHLGHQLVAIKHDAASRR